MHFDDYVYTATPSTVLYKLVDALCGTTGAGALVNEIFLARMAGALETIYFNDLDYIFGKVAFLARSPAESYPYTPMIDMLTSDQWDEVRTKDAWYRARIKDFFAACNLGGTPDGIRMCVQAALAVDCDIYEVWRYLDNFGLNESLGRSPADARNELVVRPYKGSLAPEELRLVRDMLAKICPLDTIVTVSLDGLAVQSPVPVAAAASDSEYFEVQKMVTATPALANLPAPELLPIDLLPTETWLYDAQTDPTLAPYTAFNISSEYGYYYLVGGGNRSPIDSVAYGTINTGSLQKISVFEMSGTYTQPNGKNTTIPSSSWFSSNLDPVYFQWVKVPYPADQYPISASMTTATTNLINLINATPGPFVLVGFGQGAIATSNAYDAIRTGSLTSRATDFRGGFAFGNPRRQAGVTFPNCTDPGGHGVFGTDLLTSSGSNWWEFALPNDVIAVSPATGTGPHYQSAFETLYTLYEGNLNAMITAMTQPMIGLRQYAQTLLNLLFSGSTAYTHDKYTTTKPVHGDTRTCVQIAADQISSLKLFNPNDPAALAALKAQNAAVRAAMGSAGPVTCYEVGEVNGMSIPSWFATNLDPAISYIRVSYPASTVPLAEAISAGVANLITLINQKAGRFLLIGTGEGAAITSLVYDQIHTGSLQNRKADLLAGVAFGNPRRQAATIFPGGTDPGGAGIDSSPLTGTQSLWWEFANPGDALATNVSGSTGTLMTQLYEAILADYTGDINDVTTQFTDTSTVNVAPLAQGLVDTLLALDSGTGPHEIYENTTPLTGDTRTSFQIARDYLNTFAHAVVAPPVVPATDPMDSYVAANNYQVFDTTGQYSLPIPYDKADSPDNYPGGKYGIHPDAAPALNPDGTPYNFTYVSQAVYVAQKVIAVLAGGGLANSTSYQMPLTAPSSSARVFLPEYAIAYSPPAKDSTVSSSITARHGDPSAQITTEPRDPTNFVRSNS